MVGTTLVDLREHVEALASADSEYIVVCGRTGERPVPISSLRFAERATARSAARVAEQYREALRRYDPQLPHHDLIVCQDAGRLQSSRQTPREMARRTLSKPVLDDGSPTAERRDRVEFCHGVAAAVFETLSEEGYDSVERAVIDAYFDLAETIADPNDLCLCLLEGMARELARQLVPAEQAAVLAEAATRLAPTDEADRPVEATLSVLEDRGLLGSYTRSSSSGGHDDGTRSVVVRLSEYTLTPCDGALPVLPLVVELHRHEPDWAPSSLLVVDVDEGWQVTIVLSREPDQSGLASAPIYPGV